MPGKRGPLPNKRLHIEVKAEETGELYPDQADHEDWDDIEVMVELLCDHPDVEGSFEIIGPRWKVKDILEEIGIDPDDVKVTARPGVGASYSLKPALIENPEETVTEVFQDIAKKNTGKGLDPFQETLVHVVDSWLRVR